MAVTLGEALLSAIAKGMIGIGEGSGGTLPDAGKDAGTEAPASQYREVVPTQRADEKRAPASPANGRPIVTASPTSLPRSAVAIGLVLVVDNERGGDRRREGAASVAFRTRAGGGGRGCKLKLVVG